MSKELPVRIEGPAGAGHHALEYVNETIDVSDADEITLKKDHNVITLVDADRKV
jgi:4-diphosphocytidyl-2C-methyl-D-erythritol kinase